MFKALKIKLMRRARRMSSLSPSDDNSVNHKTAASIFRMALRDPEAELLLKPVQGKRIIKLESKGMYIILYKTMLEISNHAFSYHLEISYEKYLNLSKLFDKKLDTLIEKEEGAINEQVSAGLSNVLQTFKQNKNERNNI